MVPDRFQLPLTRKPAHIARQRRVFNWRPEPNLGSVGAHNDGKDEDPSWKGVTVVFDNGLLANVPFRVLDEGQWASCGDTGIDSDGSLAFGSRDRIGSAEPYRRVVLGPRQPGDAAN